VQNNCTANFAIGQLATTASVGRLECAVRGVHASPIPNTNCWCFYLWTARFRHQRNAHIRSRRTAEPLENFLQFSLSLTPAQPTGAWL